MVELVYVRRWEKRNRCNAYWRIVKVCVGSIGHGGIETFWVQNLYKFGL